MKNFFSFLVLLLLICSNSQAQRVILSQGFENGPYTTDSIPLNWAKVKVNGPGGCTVPAADWRVRDSASVFCNTNSIYNFTAKAYGNTRKSLSIPWTATTGTLTDDWVFTNSLNIQTGDSLIFYCQLGTYPGGTATYYPDSLQVWVTSGQTPATQIARLGTVRSLAAATNFWQEIKFDLSAYNGQSVNIAFRYHMNTSLNGIMVNVDSVMVRNLSASAGACMYTYGSQTSGTTATLYSISSVDHLVAWTAGTGSAVRRTTDGGTTWTNANPTPGTIVGDIYNIYAVDASTAFVTTSPAATFIYKTVNGGTTWTQVYTLAGGFINGIEMVSPLIGFAEGDPTPVGGNWTILTTVDGGNTWTRMPTEPTGVGEAGWNNSFQASGTHIWFGTNNTRVYHSTNLGVTWTSAATTGSLNTYGLYFKNATHGVAAGSAGVYTTDGGATWTATTIPGTGNVSGVTGGNNDFWVVRGTNMYRSSNNGQSWITTAVYTGTGTLWDMDSKVSSGCPTGWAVGASGQIVKITGNPVGISGNPGSVIPSSYMLKQNFPNPFNPTTNIHFDLPVSGLVTLKVFDITGKEVATLVNDVRPAGSYIVDFNASGLPSGAYFYRIQTGSFVDTKKMMLVK